MRQKSLGQGQYLSLRQVAERLSVSERTVMRRIGDGELRASRIGRLIRIAEAEIQRYIERNEIQAA